MFLVIILLTLCFLPFFAANAYLDPGSGSFIIQLVVGAILGSLVALKMYFKNIKKSILKFFGKKMPTKKVSTEEEMNKENDSK